MAFQLPKLPYSADALAGFLSDEQMQFHYGKHHAAYITKLNGLIDGKREADWPLRQIITHSEGALLNNAAQAWNHTFFWNCLAPRPGNQPTGEVKSALDKWFGGFELFRQKFSDAATGLFGSGWTWLAKDGAGKLEILALSNADTPLRHGREPILTIDVWEHAYYIDYRNERPRYIQAFWERVNWGFVEQCYMGQPQAEGL
jgi:superoxide dismutase, Fe-Mn family